MWTTNRPNGSVQAVVALEIASIPASSVFRDACGTEADVEKRVQSGIRNMLSEIWQNYSKYKKRMPSSDMALELIWRTKAVENQPYKAEIFLYLVIRVQAYQKDFAEEMAASFAAGCEASLKLYKYKIKEIQASELKEELQKLQAQEVRALVKEERLDMVSGQQQIQGGQRLVPRFAYDLLFGGAADISSFVNCLIEYPDCAVSLQLLPTSFTEAEHQTILRMARQTKFMPEDRIPQIYQYYLENKDAPLYQFGILIYGDHKGAEHIAAKLRAQLTFDPNRAARLNIIALPQQGLRSTEHFEQYPWQAVQLLMQSQRNMQIWTANNSFRDFYRLPYVITSEEAVKFFRLPVGTAFVSAGLRVNRTDSSSKTYADNLINAGDISLGVLRGTGDEDEIGISLNDLTKHMLVTGTPGSGKTTFSIGLLDRLWNEFQIPFLVIEPAKNEYRALVQRIPDIQIFTPGKNFISPFVFNPFVPPKNVKLEAYKSTLKTAFAAGVSMASPLDVIFEEAIYNCYSDFRWLDSYTVEDGGQIFNISDFIKCFQETFDAIGYSGDAQNIGRAGVVRLNGLLKLFDHYHSIPIEDLLQRPTIIELAAIENAEQKALIIALILLSVLSYVNFNYSGEGKLKNVILLEEAHVLLGAGNKYSQSDASPAQVASELIKRMLAEVRAYGVGMIIADQSPRKVTEDIVGLTDMKVVFRLVEGSDKQIIADSMNMSENQVQRLARLKPGEAFLFFNRLDDPEEILTPDYRMNHKISVTLQDMEIRELSSYWKTRKKELRPYPECRLVSFCQYTCDLDRRMLAKEVARRIFVHHFQPSDDTLEPVKEVFGSITKLVLEELDNEPFSQEILSCVKCQLWRKIKYGTKIPVKPIQIENSLKKV